MIPLGYEIHPFYEIYSLQNVKFELCLIPMLVHMEALDENREQFLSVWTVAFLDRDLFFTLCNLSRLGNFRQ